MSGLGWILVLLLGWWMLGFRVGLFLVIIALVVTTCTGCTLLAVDDAAREQAEYERVEWVETQFKPAVDACERNGGILVYDGPYSQRMSRILKTRDWSSIHRTEWLNFRCSKRS